MIQVVIVDDDIEAAKALKRNIDGHDNISVAAIFDNGTEAVIHCPEKKPDIVLMDVKMPGMSGLEACEKIKLGNPLIKILIMTFYQVKENEINAIKKGCDGYIYKGHKSADIISIIKSTYNGFSVFEDVVKETLHNQMNDEDVIKIKKDELAKLSQREIEIVRLITAGKKDMEISKELFVSEGYVRNQLVMIREKLSLRNSKELAVWGARAGL